MRSMICYKTGNHISFDPLRANMEFDPLTMTDSEAAEGMIPHSSSNEHLSSERVGSLNSMPRAESVPLQIVITRFQWEYVNENES